MLSQMSSVPLSLMNLIGGDDKVDIIDLTDGVDLLDLMNLVSRVYLVDLTNRNYLADPMNLMDLVTRTDLKNRVDLVDLVDPGLPLFPAVSNQKWNTRRSGFKILWTQNGTPGGRTLKRCVLQTSPSSDPLNEE